MNLAEPWTILDTAWRREVGGILTKSLEMKNPGLSQDHYVDENEDSVP
jgi:hypothetical protein